MKYDLAIGLALGMALAFSVSYLIAQEFGFVADKDLQSQIVELERQKKTNLQT